VGWGLAPICVVGVAGLVGAVGGGERAGEQIAAGAAILNDRGGYLVVVGGVAVGGEVCREDQTAAGWAGPWIGGHSHILSVGAGLEASATHRGMNRLHKRMRREVAVSCFSVRSWGWNGGGRKIVGGCMNGAVPVEAEGNLGTPPCPLPKGEGKVGRE
jgi:hypothetical protein